MLLGLLAILSCQLVGEVLAYEASLPVPGPVLGMMLLIIVLACLDRIGGKGFVDRNPEVTTSGEFILRNMSLLFVPAGVGVIQKMDVLLAHGIGLSIVIVVSTLLTLMATVLAFLAGARLSRRWLAGAKPHD
ncbi:CidA/LrgA family protein [Rhizobium sp. 11515TR]|uniref:CidA/LrgA family protein n=1 Tax=Rhizobium sp. 11515TR TaxID=2028343 RepID=UPI000BA8C511|nr:CidA/LrgA family protein [Rhizobium sp. 11515TR]ASW09874.1 hypothetical protein CKA34_28020 [Rhizobium sp. 11515TR]